MHFLLRAISQLLFYTCTVIKAQHRKALALVIDLGYYSGCSSNHISDIHRLFFVSGGGRCVVYIRTTHIRTTPTQIEKRAVWCWCWLFLNVESSGDLRASGVIGDGMEHLCAAAEFGREEHEPSVSWMWWILHCCWLGYLSKLLSSPLFLSPVFPTSGKSFLSSSANSNIFCLPSLNCSSI